MRTLMLAIVTILGLTGIGTAQAAGDQYQYGPAYINSSTATQAVPAGQGFPGAGANGLYTRLQAQERIQRAGFTDVTGLTRNWRAVWHGQAMKSGILNQVAVDGAGDVTSGVIKPADNKVAPFPGY
jgi:hypothetical protein